MQMNPIIENIITRRAIRQFKPDPVPEAVLDTILEAGLFAPSAGGRQASRMLVCQDAALNLALGRINRDAMPFGLAKGGVSKDQPSIVDDTSLQSGFYGAPVVVTLFGPADAQYGTHDCTAVAQNMLLAAHALGLGGCMVGRAQSTFATAEGQAVLRDARIDAAWTPCIHVVLGYAQNAQAHAKPRREDRIVRIG